MHTWLAPGRLFLDYGPIQATVSAFRAGEPMPQEMEEACAYAAEQLKELTDVLALAKLPPEKVKVTRGLPDILKDMMSAVSKCDDPTLTSMAAVAGTFSDRIADFLQEKGATKVMVSNGGDLAFRLKDNESVKVGIVSDIQDKSFSHVIQLGAASPIRGICTSGFGGRSFTKGIASAAVAFGRNCREADAAATLIGNHCYSTDPGIKLVRAEVIDPDTDIAGHEVTLAIGSLQPETPAKALANAMSKVSELIGKEAIIGAAVFVQGQSVFLPEYLGKEIHPVKEKLF